MKTFASQVTTLAFLIESYTENSNHIFLLNEYTIGFIFNCSIKSHHHFLSFSGAIHYKSLGLVSTFNIMILLMVTKFILICL